MVSNTDIFLFPTRLEGCPYVILEAMKYKKKIVTSNIPSIKEITSFYPAKLCEVENVQDYITNIYKIIDQDINISSEVYSLIKKKFSLESMIKRYLELYKKILHN